MRAEPPACVTAASWSAASSATLSFGWGRRSWPCSTCMACSTPTPSIGSRCRIGPASSQAASPVGKHEVACNRIAERLGAERERGFERRPARLAGDAHVDRVRPDEVMQLVQPERVTGAEQMVRAPLDFLGRVVERHPQLDHERPGVGRGGTQRADGLRRRLQHGGVDHEPVATLPPERLGVACDHHVPAQHGRPATAVPSRGPLRRARRPLVGRSRGCDAGASAGSWTSVNVGCPCSAQHARTSAGRAWAPPQYTHEITPATLTTGCDSGRVRGLLPGPRILNLSR